MRTHSASRIRPLFSMATPNLFAAPEHVKHFQGPRYVLELGVKEAASELCSMRRRAKRHNWKIVRFTVPARKHLGLLAKTVYFPWSNGEIVGAGIEVYL